MSWTPFERMDAREKEIKLMDEILNAQKTLNRTPLLEFKGPVPSESSAAGNKDKDTDGGVSVHMDVVEDATQTTTEND